MFLNPEHIQVQSFFIDDVETTGYTAAPGTWNDATAGCCAPSGTCPPPVVIRPYSDIPKKIISHIVTDC